MTFARRSFTALVFACVAFVSVPSPARAQDVITKESAAELKKSFLADLQVMEDKFVGLANAMPADKYTWRPMDGVRSVSEVFMLAAMEGYSFVPRSFGGKAASLGSPDDAKKLQTLTDKTQIIDHLKKGFAHAKAELTALDPATLTGTKQIMGKPMSVSAGMFAIGGDLHEHLGQMIAYARMNHIVPPWSK